MSTITTIITHLHLPLLFQENRQIVDRTKSVWVIGSQGLLSCGESSFVEGLGFLGGCDNNNNNNKQNSKNILLLLLIIIMIFFENYKIISFHHNKSN